MIHPQPYFGQRLREERNRSDRYGQPFALVLISLDKVGGDSPDSVYFFRAIESLSKSIRLSDFLGWYSEGRLGLILPDTSAQEAQVVLNRLKRSFQQMKKCRLHEIAEQNGMFSVSEYPKMLRENGIFWESSGRKGDNDEHEVSEGFHHEHGPIDSRFLDETNLCAVHRHNGLLSVLDLFARRCVDLVVSVIGLTLTFPVLILISVIIRLTSKGPILFRQKRLGKGGKEFTFLKFRTMYHNSDQNMHREYVTSLIENKAAKQERNGKSYYKMTNDPRVTPFGRFLRLASLDELPQLINVLKGEMSLVGPRPPIAYEVEKYQNWQLRRILEAKPGITGLWQVSGRSTTTFDDMVRLDLKYVKNQSLWFNFLILIGTFKAVLSMKGAY
jgi:lipopolysaccharide/colanic/teichoic acid biosynthesis glycosyltransferase